MQLYYMRKDGCSLSSSSVVLMTVAVVYKFVLVIIGTGLLIFWRRPLREHLQGYFWLYFLGLFLNVLLVILLFLVMISPEFIRMVLLKMEGLLVNWNLWRKSEQRKNSIDRFLEGYQETVCFLQCHKKRIGVIVAGTFL